MIRLVDPPQEPDEDLVARAHAGDERAFTLLYRRHVRQVARTVYAILRNDAEVDDVLQRAFADASLQLPALRDPRGFRAWVTRIAVRDAYDQLRARRRRGWLASALESW
jgi:RNA polymerase sigma-70 factor (ECF subfamily)